MVPYPCPCVLYVDPVGQPKPLNTCVDTHPCRVVHEQGGIEPRGLRVVQLGSCGSRSIDRIICRQCHGQLRTRSCTASRPNSCSTCDREDGASHWAGCIWSDCDEPRTARQTGKDQHSGTLVVVHLLGCGAVWCAVCVGSSRGEHGHPTPGGSKQFPRCGMLRTEDPHTSPPTNTPPWYPPAATPE